MASQYSKYIEKNENNEYAINFLTYAQLNF